MDVTYPIAAAGDTEAEQYAASEGAGGEGFFPVGQNHFWHGGVHFTVADEPVQAVADGEIVAYRINEALKKYEGPDAAEVDEYSNGFVLLRHRFVTPMGAEIVFFSLYMHLRPVPAAQTQRDGDPAKPPFIFEKTHWEVATDDDGRGMAILADDDRTSVGVIPFGSAFMVLPDTDKCKNERYRKVRHFKNSVRGHAMIAEGEAVLAQYDPHDGHFHHRVNRGASAVIFDEHRHPVAARVLHNGYFRFEATPAGHWSLGYRYELLAFFPKVPTDAFLANPTASARQLGAGPYYQMNAEAPLLRADTGAPLGKIARGAIFTLAAGAPAAGHWSLDAVHAPQGWKKIAYHGEAVRGCAVMPRAAEGAQGNAEAPLEVLAEDDESKKVADVAEGCHYVVLPRPASPGHYANQRRFHQVEVPDLADDDPEEGYVFVRPAWMTAIDKANPADPHEPQRYLWGRAGLSPAYTWVAPILAASNATPLRNAELKPCAFFEIADDAETPADHWSREVGWRRVRHEAVAVGEQPAVAPREGHAFLGRHTPAAPDAASPPPPGGARHRLKSYADFTSIFHNLSVAPVGALMRPGENPQNYHLQSEGRTGDACRPWDGRYNGVNVHASGDAASVVAAVLGLGSVVALDPAEDVKFKVVSSDDGAAYAPARVAFHRLADHSGHIKVDGTNVVKRAEIPKPIVHEAPTLVDPPAPIKRGDIVGYPGTYRHQAALLHFEIIAADGCAAAPASPPHDAAHVEPCFVHNPARDRWGRFFRIDAAADFKVREAEARAPTKQLPVGTAVRRVRRTVAHAQVRILSTRGYVKADALEPLPPAPPAAATHPPAAGAPAASAPAGAPDAGAPDAGTPDPSAAVAAAATEAATGTSPTVAAAVAAAAAVTTRKLKAGHNVIYRRTPRRDLENIHTYNTKMGGVEVEALTVPERATVLVIRDLHEILEVEHRTDCDDLWWVDEAHLPRRASHLPERQTLTQPLDVYQDNPDDTWILRAPTDPEKPALAALVAGLPRNRLPGAESGMIEVTRENLAVCFTPDGVEWWGLARDRDQAQAVAAEADTLARRQAADAAADAAAARADAAADAAADAHHRHHPAHRAPTHHGTQPTLAWAERSAFKERCAYDWPGWKLHDAQEEEPKVDDPETTGVHEDKFSTDGFCDIPALLAKLGIVGTVKDHEPEELDAHGAVITDHAHTATIQAAYARSEVADDLRRSGYRHPTEWDCKTDARIKKYERLKLAPFHMTTARYDQTLKHIEAMQWWDGAKAATQMPADPGKVWNLHPIGFLAQLRRLGWLRRAQLLAIYGKSRGVQADWYLVHLNDAMETYEINTPERQAHFLGQLAPECDRLQTMGETNHTYLGDDPFWGRGAIQLTGEGNYVAYERWIRGDVTSTMDAADSVAGPSPKVPPRGDDDVAGARLAIDSAGFFWQMAKLNHAARGAVTAANIRSVSGTVNSGVNGLGLRVLYTLRAAYHLGAEVGIDR